MTLTELLQQDFSAEFDFQAARSGGPGGQNVNKVASKVELRFNVEASKILDESQKNKIKQKLATQITLEGILLIVCQESRSQLQNKQTTIKKFKLLLEKALKTEKTRKASAPTAMMIAKRLNDKKANSTKKSQRRFDLNAEE
jgi:ribosome-associated protein